MQRKILENLKQLESSKNMNEEAVKQGINEDSKLGCYELLSDEDIVTRVVYGSEETK